MPNPASVPLLSPCSLKLAVLGLAVSAPLLLGGCDRESGDAAQPAAQSASTAAGAGAGAAAGELSGTIDRSHKGSQLPEFVLNDPAGKQLRLSSLKGKPALINLWATWCGPCVIEMPMLNALSAKAPGGLQVITVSQDLGTPEKVAAFFTDRKLANLGAWLDPESELSTHYSVTTLPTTIYYDAEGREVWRFVGGHDWSSAETTKMLAETN